MVTLFMPNKSKLILFKFFIPLQSVGVHALTVTGLHFIAVTDIQTPRQQASQFITEVAKNFADKPTRVDKARNGGEGCLQNSFQSTLKHLMADFEQYKSNLQMNALQANVEGVTNQLRVNVSDLMKRGEMASSLVDRTNDMETSAGMFKTTSAKVEKKERCANMRMKFILIGVGGGVLLLIIIIILWQVGALSSK